LTIQSDCFLMSSLRVAIFYYEFRGGWESLHTTDGALLKAAKTFLKITGTCAAFSNALLAEVGTAAVRTQQLYRKK